MNPIGKLACGLLALLGIAVLVQRGISSSPLQGFQEAGRDPQLVLIKSVVAGWNQGEKLWEFRGDKLVVDHAGRFLTYRGNGLGRLYHLRQAFMTVWAPQIRLDLLTRSVAATQGVHLYANPSTTLTTQALYWNEVSQRLYVPGLVKLTSPYGSFTAREVMFVVYAGRLRMLGVRMAIDPDRLPFLEELLQRGTQGPARMKKP